MIPIKIRDIIEFPTVIRNMHESCYKSYQVLEYVKAMLLRGDSPETVLEVIDHIYCPQKPKEDGN